MDVGLETLKRYLGERREPPPLNHLSAAVSVILNNQLEVLLIKRAQRDSDPWSGQWALPGGMSKPTDGDMFETARRETFEEVGIDIRELELLGWMNARRPKNRPEIAVSPVVLLSEGRLSLRLNQEVTDAIWLPLVAVERRKSRITRRDGESLVDAYTYDRAFVWGLTASVIDELKQLLTPNPC
ncbi:MAG: CoA pyrophosphatase [Aigarchaeota archaeon]|nr:CoA pyrophosphatase [Aigarchaeota archaeon]